MSASPVVGLIDLPIWKGHGTENDFVVIDDRDDRLDLSVDMVVALCDRRAGIGGDGVLRVVRLPAEPTRFFMDYRNADGSLAEMCGNGARVFAHYLRTAGLIDADAFVLSTRAGDVGVRMHDDGQVTVDLGPVSMMAVTPVVRVAGLTGHRRSTAVAVPNPHVVVVLDDLGELQALDLSTPPLVDPPLPAGQNVEFVVRTGARRLSMRVHERGSGETRSCGTGIAAAVVAVTAHLRPRATPDQEEPDQGESDQDAHDEWQVDVPGGAARVRWSGGERAQLTGPAVLVGRVEVSREWVARAAGSAGATASPSGVARSAAAASSSAPGSSAIS